MNNLVFSLMFKSVKKCKNIFTSFTNYCIFQLVGGGKMPITDYMTVTELARLTHKSRPSIYKYVESYEQNNYDDIPYSIIELFKMIESGNSKQAILYYCNKKFGNTQDNSIQEIINLLNDNKDKIDMNKIKQLIEEEIKNG